MVFRFDDDFSLQEVPWPIEKKMQCFTITRLSPTLDFILPDKQDASSLKMVEVDCRGNLSVHSLGRPYRSLDIRVEDGINYDLPFQYTDDNFQTVLAQKKVDSHGGYFGEDSRLAIVKKFPLSSMT